MNILAGFLLILFMLTGLSNASQNAFSQEDRERLVRLEEGLKSLQKQMDDMNQSIQKQINETNTSLQRQIESSYVSLQKQIDTLQTFMLWGFGILFGGMGILIGFVIWDRRTAVEPVSKKVREMQEREEKIEKVLKELAKTDERVSRALREAGL